MTSSKWGMRRTKACSDEGDEEGQTLTALSTSTDANPQAIGACGAHGIWMDDGFCHRQADACAVAWGRRANVAKTCQTLRPQQMNGERKNGQCQARIHVRHDKGVFRTRPPPVERRGLKKGPELRITTQLHILENKDDSTQTQRAAYRME